MGFKEIRRQVIQAIRDGGIQHEARDEIEEKNLLRKIGTSSSIFWSQKFGLLVFIEARKEAGNETL